MRILGIDPGYGRMGFGVVEGGKNVWRYVAHGCIETSAKSPFPDRLKALHAAVQAIIAEHHPARAAVEDLFFAKNAKTAMQVGEARGVILLTLFEAGLAVDSYTPMQVKQAITGYGRAEKGQVERMLRLLLPMSKKAKLPDDAADALAVALTAGLSLPPRRCG